MKVKRRKPSAEVPNAAMGDIAFNLLIFFVILAKATDDSHLAWTPAAASNLETAASTQASIVVDKDSLLYLNGVKVGKEQLAASLQNMLQNATTEQQRTVLLKVHNKTKRDKYEPVIEAISEAGGIMVHVLNEEN